jgi:geranylgeranyl diphosphate synthase type I
MLMTSPRPVPAVSDRATPNPAPDAVGSIDRVEALLWRLAAGSRLDRLGAIVEEHLQSGGRRIRARLAIGACEALGVTEPRAVVWAAACELLHNASLVHDDIQDGDTLRRGRPTTWARHGVAQAINAGDLLLMLPFSVLRHLDGSDAERWQLSLATSTYAETTVRGQASEIELRRTWRLDWDSYHRAVEGKTAALFALPVHGAAVLAGRAAEAPVLAEPFAALGVLFQLQDDVVDLYGDKGRGEQGADLREGKISALVVEHLRLVPTDRDRLISLLEAPRDRTTEADIAWAASRFEASGALVAVLGRIRQIAERVSRAPELAGEPALAAVAAKLLALSLAPIGHLLTPPSRHEPAQGEQLAAAV